MIDRRQILDDCRAVVVEYCCCEMCPAGGSSCAACFDGLDWVDMYEICLGVALRVTGEKEMAWDDFLRFRECVHDSLEMLCNSGHEKAKPCFRADPLARARAVML